jgi:hypothetical protein
MRIITETRPIRNTLFRLDFTSAYGCDFRVGSGLEGEHKMAAFLWLRIQRTENCDAGART